MSIAKVSGVRCRVSDRLATSKWAYLIKNETYKFHSVGFAIRLDRSCISRQAKAEC